MKRILCVVLVVLAGCAPGLEPVLSFDDGRDGAWGTDGRFGAGLMRDSFRVRVSESADVDVFVPLDEEDEPAAGPFAPVLLLQGGLVETARYHWLAAHIASRGHVVFMPHHIGNLAFFESNLAADVLEAGRDQAATGQGPLRGLDPDAPALVTGHSLGGVVAAKAWLYDETVTHLVLLASIPDPADAVETGTGLVVSVAGATDGRIDPAEIADGAEAFSAPTVFAVVDGMNHFAYTDNNSDADLESDGPLEVDQDVARARATFMLDGALADLVGADSAALFDAAAWPAGVHR